MVPLLSEDKHALSNGKWGDSNKNALYRRALN